MSAIETKDDENVTHKLETFQLGNIRCLGYFIHGDNLLKISFLSASTTLEDLKESELSPEFNKPLRAHEGVPLPDPL